MLRAGNAGRRRTGSRRGSATLAGPAGTDCGREAGGLACAPRSPAEPGERADGRVASCPTSPTGPGAGSGSVTLAPEEGWSSTVTPAPGAVGPDPLLARSVGAPLRTKANSAPAAMTARAPPITALARLPRRGTSTSRGGVAVLTGSTRGFDVAGPKMPSISPATDPNAGGCREVVPPTLDAPLDVSLVRSGRSAFCCAMSLPDPRLATHAGPSGEGNNEGRRRLIPARRQLSEPHQRRNSGPIGVENCKRHGRAVRIRRRAA